jgi:hypothetical protein
MLGRIMAVDYAIATLSEAISAIGGGLLQDKAEMTPEDVSYAMAIVALATSLLWTRYFYGARVPTPLLSPCGFGIQSNDVIRIAFE